MANFFNAIWDFIQTIWQVAINLFQSILSLIQVAISAVTVPQQLAILVFAPLSACMLAVLAVSVLKLIIGRDNN